MAENQSEHRISTERYIVEHDVEESKRGQYIGAFIVIVFVVAAFILGLKGHDWLAGVIITLVVSLTVIFVLKKNPQKDEKLETQNEEDKL